MSTSGLGVNSSTSAPITITGLASGLETSKIIGALMSAQREPVTHLTDEEQRLHAEQSDLQGIQSSLQQLAAAASEFSSPTLFENSQTVSSSEPARVSAAMASGSGAGVGGYEVEVTQLANAAQRTFTFTSPTKAETITIEGHEFKLNAGETAKQLASEINTDSSATVYAAVLEGETLVLSNRATGNTGTEFIKVTDPGGVLTETGKAKEGKNAEFMVDGVAGTAATNTVTNAIAGVTLTLSGLTQTGPVTIDVGAPGPSASAVEAQVQSFVKLYNSAVESIQAQLKTKPPVKPENGEFGVGVLFGDVELSGLLDSMRTTMYEPIAGLEANMSSPFDIGISTGNPTGESASSQSSLEGLLTVEPAKLSEAVKANPAGVQKMLQQWSQNLQGLVNAAGGPGGTIEGRTTGDASQITELNSQIANMNEMLAHREKALQATYAELESVISKNSAQGDWLTQQEESLDKSSK
jgi:flagellar hook-associated protein 2